MRHRLLLPLLAVVPFAFPAGAQAGHCTHYGTGHDSLCTQHVSSHGHEVGNLGSCHAKTFFAIDASPFADASADGHYVAPARIRMFNGIWSNHAKYGPLDAAVAIHHGHFLSFTNASSFGVVVHYTKVCA
jgi:hypothetical protein